MRVATRSPAASLQPACVCSDRRRRSRRRARQPAARRSASERPLPAAVDAAETHSTGSDSPAPAAPPLALALLATVQPGAGGSGGEDDVPIANPAVLLASGTAGNAAMGLTGAALGDWQGLDVTSQLLTAGDLSLPAAVAYMLPLGAICVGGVAFADRIPGFLELRALFKELLIPQLKPLRIWGLGLLALGAGVGEETLFRGFMQAAAVDSLSGALPALPATATTAAGLLGTSVVFGALHALTPSYFFFATAAGVLFGIEFLYCGLQTAAATHFLYDWAALIYIVSEWGGSSSDGGGPGSGPGQPAAAAAADSAGETEA